jgi:hypothetical protein
MAVEMVWWDEALSSELSLYFLIGGLITFVFWGLYVEPEALSYEIFM